MEDTGFAWATIVWVNDHIHNLGLTALYSLCLVTIFAVIKKRLAQKRPRNENERPTEDICNELSIVRKLCKFESSTDHLHKYGGSVTAHVLLLKSNVYLHPTLVKNALVYLTKKHQILRMKITRTKMRIQGRKKVVKEFREMENQDFAEFHLKLKATTSDQWVTVFERELMKQFPEEGPLWRFVMLKEQFEPKEGVYSNAFVLSAHQLICDFESGISFFEEFVRYLELWSRDVSSLEVNVSSDTIFHLRPSFSQLLRNHISMSQPAIAYAACRVFILKAIDRIWPTKTCKNPFTLAFPPTILKDPSIIKKTCLIPRTLNKEETDKLIKICKTNKCTINGALFAATTIAMATILEKATAPLTVSSSFHVDLRKGCDPCIDPGELGCFSVSCQISVPLTDCPSRPSNINDVQFWKFSKKCDQILHKAIQNEDHLNSMKIMETLRINPSRHLGKLAQDIEAAGRHSALFHVSNLGKRSMLESNPVISFEGFYSAVAEHNVGPVFSTNIVTINGILHLGFTYFTNVTTEEQAVEFADLVVNCLKTKLGRKQ